MVDVSKYRVWVVGIIAVLLIWSLCPRPYPRPFGSTPWSQSNTELTQIKDTHYNANNYFDLRDSTLDFFIDTIMNLQYNYFPGHIDGNVVPPNALALSMAGKRRLDNFALCVSTVINEGIPGDVIETGAWKGGASFVAAKVIDLLHASHARKVYICDSFKGIPAPPSDRQYNQEDHNANFPVFSEVSAAKVTVDAQRFSLPVENLRVIEGYFNVTLPALVVANPSLQLSVLRLDGDTYFSTMDALKVLYPRLSPGGFVIVDDFIDWEGCRDAVLDYRRMHNILEPIVLVPHLPGEILRGAYWRKSGRVDWAKKSSLHTSAAEDSWLCLGANRGKHNTRTDTVDRLLVPQKSYRPLRVLGVTAAGPVGFVYDRKVFANLTNIKMCM